MFPTVLLTISLLSLSLASPIPTDLSSSTADTFPSPPSSPITAITPSTDLEYLEGPAPSRQGYEPAAAVPSTQDGVYFHIVDYTKPLGQGVSEGILELGAVEAAKDMIKGRIVAGEERETMKDRVGKFRGGMDRAKGAWKGNWAE